MRFRLFRSRAFWFGVPGLVFLLWGWWISTGHHSWARFAGGRVWGIGQMRWEVYVLWNSDGGTGWGNSSFGRMEMTGEEVRQLKDAWAATRKKDPSFYRHVFIPYRWPVLGYVAGWAGLTFWRSQRYRAAAQPR